MKRSYGDREIETQAMANCLMLLSRVGKNSSSLASDRVFECKTCNKKFSSFQALGGHRASHKKPRLMGGTAELLHMVNESSVKAKISHECSICGQEFPMGQALGGHMRRHRSPTDKSVAEKIPVLKKCNSKRILCLDLDLNLTPYENELKLEKTARVLNCF